LSRVLGYYLYSRRDSDTLYIKYTKEDAVKSIVDSFLWGFAEGVGIGLVVFGVIVVLGVLCSLGDDLARKLFRVED
jgi:hypothetical protein